MNSVAARLCIYSNEYPWGSGGIYFKIDGGIKSIFSKQNASQVQRLGDLSASAQRRMLHSHIQLNQDWEIIDGAYISPASYVSVDLVEKIYKTANSFSYFMNSSAKARARQETKMADFSDHTVRMAAIDIRLTAFNKSAEEQLSQDELRELLRQLKGRLSANTAQLSRVLEMREDVVSSLLDMF